MNKARRGEIEKVVNMLSDAADTLRQCYYDECDVRDNTPEGLQSTSRYADCEYACETMESAIDSIDDAINGLNELV